MVADSILLTRKRIEELLLFTCEFILTFIQEKYLIKYMYIVNSIQSIISDKRFSMLSISQWHLTNI